ncbi:MAG: MFS transporter, partial [Candidatus Rokuibacteriota bacterium]
SLGGLAGAAVAGLIAFAGIGAMSHVAATALVGGAVVLIALRALVVVRPSPSAAFARPTRELLGLGVLALCALLAEGAMADWSAVYLMDARGASQGAAAAGFAAFSLAMAAGRFGGDRVALRFGALNLLRMSGGLAAVGLFLALMVREPLIAIAGLGLVGLGVANLIPVLFSAAGRANGVAPGPALAAVATTGYVGFLAGPPLIGIAAELTGLPAALGIVVLACVGVAVAAGVAGDRS